MKLRSGVSSGSTVEPVPSGTTAASRAAPPANGDQDSRTGSVRPGQTHRQVDRQVDSPAHEVLQHRALPGALAAHHRDLRQVEVRVLAYGGERVLEPVHQRDELLHPPVPHGGETGGETDRRSRESDRQAERQTGESESDRQAEELEAAGGGSDRQTGSSSETGRDAAVSRHDAVLGQLINPIS